MFYLFFCTFVMKQCKICPLFYDKLCIVHNEQLPYKGADTPVRLL